jgi:hypothetical protein
MNIEALAQRTTAQALGRRRKRGNPKSSSDLKWRSPTCLSPTEMHGVAFSSVFALNGRT